MKEIIFVSILGGFGILTITGIFIIIKKSQDKYKQQLDLSQQIVICHKERCRLPHQGGGFVKLEGNFRQMEYCGRHIGIRDNSLYRCPVCGRQVKLVRYWFSNGFKEIEVKVGIKDAQNEHNVSNQNVDNRKLLHASTVPTEAANAQQAPKLNRDIENVAYEQDVQMDNVHDRYRRTPSAARFARKKRRMQSESKRKQTSQIPTKLCHTGVLSCSLGVVGWLIPFLGGIAAISVAFYAWYKINTAAESMSGELYAGVGFVLGVVQLIVYFNIW